MDELFGGESLGGVREALTYVIQTTYGALTSGDVPLDAMPKEYRAPMGKSGRCGTHCGRGHGVVWGVGVQVLARPAAWTSGRVEMVPRTVADRGTDEPAPVVGWWTLPDATLNTWVHRDVPMVVPCWREEDMAGQLRLRALDGADLAAVGANEPIVLLLVLQWSN